jgi:5-methyltetrahydropteroyltriglutamate--homocysteine methyltransferase
VASLCGKILKELKNDGAKRFRLEEPAFILNLTNKEVEILIEAYSLITKDLNIAIYVQTYYESLSQYNKIVNELPVCGIGVNFCRKLRNRGLKTRSCNETISVLKNMVNVAKNLLEEAIVKIL